MLRKNKTIYGVVLYYLLYMYYCKSIILYDPFVTIACILFFFFFKMGKIKLYLEWKAML